MSLTQEEREFLAYLELKRRNPMEGHIMGLRKILEHLQQAEKGVTQLLERGMTTGNKLSKEGQNSTDIMSCTFTIEQKGNKFEAYCEAAQQVISGPASTGVGSTPLEAAENAYKRLAAFMEEEEEDNERIEIDDKLDELEAEAKADEATGNLIPGGFDGIGEFSDELQDMVKELIRMAHKGMTEREQHKVAGYVLEAMAAIEVDRVPDDDDEDNT